MSEPVALMTKRAIEQVERAIRKLNGIKGVGCLVKHVNDNIVIEVQQQGQRRPASVGVEDAVLFPVLIKRVGGSDGNATTVASWTYDLYELADTGYVTKLNTSALQPVRSPARMLEGKVTRPSDGSVGMAYIDAAGDIQLWDLGETRTKFACT
jgi:hypothetical protein